MARDAVAHILDLEIEDRILAVEAIWDSIAADPEAVPVTEAQCAELDRRLVNVVSGTDLPAWEDVRGRLAGSG